MKDKTTPPDGGNDFQILQEDFVHFAGARMCRIYEVTSRGGCTQDLASGYRIRNNFWEKKTQISWKTWQKIIIIKCTYLIQTNPCMQIIYIHLRAHILLITQLQYQTLDEHTVHHIFPSHFAISSIPTACSRSVPLMKHYQTHKKHLPSSQDPKKQSNSSLTPLYDLVSNGIGLYTFWWIRCIIKTSTHFHASTCLSATVEYNSFSNAAAASAFIQKKVGVFVIALLVSSFCCDETNRFYKLQDLIILGTSMFPNYGACIRCDMCLCMIHLTS